MSISPVRPQRALPPADPQSRTIRCGSRAIHLSEAGEGFPVLLLHGGGPGASGMSNYSRNVAALAGRFHCLVPDMQGYGRSSKGIDGRDPFGDLADAMLGLLDALEIEKAHVIGNSLGGACALFAATGHWVQWERADEFNVCSMAFLERHTPAASRAIGG